VVEMRAATAAAAARPDSAATTGALLSSTGDIETIMESLQNPQGTRGLSRAGHTHRRLADVPDCLAGDRRGVHGPPSLTSRTPPPSKPRGWTLAGKSSGGKRYLGRALLSKGSESPGPMYLASPTTNTQYPKKHSFPREKRAFVGGRTTPGPGPAGRGYELPSTLFGQDKTRAASPACRFGSAKRFRTAEFISMAHSKNSNAGPAGTPGPQEYVPADSKPNARSAPAFSFASQDAAKGEEQSRFNSKVYISRAHAAVQGPSYGRNNPGPAPGQDQPSNRKGISGEPGSRFDTGPSWSFSSPPDKDKDRDGLPPRSRSAPPPGRANRVQFISAAHAAKEPPRDADMLPGPGAYFTSVQLEKEAGGVSPDTTISQKDGMQSRGRPPSYLGGKCELLVPQRDAAARALDTVKEKAPSYSFGLHAKAGNRYYSAALAEAGPKGRESPGPCHAVDIVSSTPCYSFAGPDVEDAKERSRFEVRQYIGRGIAPPPGAESPGPAEYNVTDVELPAGPAHSFARKEKQLMKRICPAPERARFYSKELARENMGCFGPGPKYLMPGGFGKAPVSRGEKGTFGMSDRSWPDGYQAVHAETSPAPSKPHTNPGEARYLGKEYSVSQLGRYGPGPMYNPEYCVERVAQPRAIWPPDMEAEAERQAELEALNRPPERHEILSKHASAPAVSIGSRPTHKKKYDSRDHSPNAAITRPKAPSFGFGTSTRSGAPIPPPTKELGAAGVKGTGAHDQHHHKKQEVDRRNLEVSPGPGSFTPNYWSVMAYSRSAKVGGIADGIGMGSEAFARAREKAKKREKAAALKKKKQGTA